MGVLPSQGASSLQPVHEPPSRASEWNEPQLDLRALVQVLARRRWVALGVLAGALLLGGLVTLRAPRVYRAQATVHIERHAPEVLADVREVYDLGSTGWWAAQEYYETQYNVIRSRPVAQRTAAHLGLVPQTLIEQLRAAGPTPIEARSVGNPLAGLPHDVQVKLRLLGIEGLADREEMLAVLATIDPAAVIGGKVLVEPVKDSQLVAIVIEDNDAERAATFANAVVEAYIEFNLDQKVTLTRSALDWLSDQMHELKDKLRVSEMDLHDFKRENNIVSVSMEDRQTMIAQTLTQLNQSLSETRAKRLALESRRNRARQVREGGTDLDALGDVISNSLVQRLKGVYSDLKLEERELEMRYTGEHPALNTVRQKIGMVHDELDREIDKILRSLDEDFAAAFETEQRLQSAIAGVTHDALEINKKEIEYNRRKRERDNNEALYQLVLKRQKEADLTQFLKVNNVRKLEAALVPPFPVRPRVQLNLLVALVIGLIGGIGLAFLIDYLDNTVKTQSQVEQVLGLPFLGIIPAIKDKSAKMVNATERDHYIITHPRSSVAECCRTIRTNLMFMSPDRPARMLLVTSSGPREGKSTTVINLGFTMALSGARTVIVDTDMRKPRLHHSFGVSNDFGISSVILGERTLNDVMRSTAVERLKIITCGPIPPNPAELLHTDTFRQIVRDLSERFDRVLFDSPPISAVTDAQVLGSMTDGIVLVIEANKTSWQAGRQAKQRIESVGGRVFGVVLNNVDLDDKRSGEYYQYYDYYYRSGYGDEEPQKEAASL